VVEIDVGHDLAHTVVGVVGLVGIVDEHGLP
jgi:hypothetical protein